MCAFCIYSKIFGIDMKKILHLLQSSHFSGAENVVCQIIKLFQGEEYEMIYASPDGTVRPALQERGIKFYPLKDFSIKSIKAAINDIKPDLVHAHDMRASFFASAAVGGLPLVSHIHNNGFDARKISAKSVAFLLGSRKINHIFWVSKSALDDYYFKKFVSSKSSLLKNIIDINEIRERAANASDKTEYDMMYLGRLAYPKNPMRFIELVKLVKETVPDVRVAIVGSGDQTDLTKELVTKYGLEENVRFLGFISNPAGILKGSKVLSITSFWEGTPMCALEALTLGTPIVATPIDGLKDMIVNHQNGFLHDEDKALATEIVKIITNKEYRLYLSENAVKCAEELNNKNKYKEALKAVYDRYLPNK